MKVGETVKIKNTNSVFDEKKGLVEWIDEEGGTCTVFVDFVPGQDKKVRQDFALDNVELYNSDDDIEVASVDNKVYESICNKFTCDRDEVIELEDNIYEILGERYWIGTASEESEFLKESKATQDEEDTLEKGLEEFLTMNHMIDHVVLEDTENHTTSERIELENNLVAYKLR